MKKNYFKNSQNLIVYKMILLSLSGVQGMTSSPYKQYSTAYIVRDQLLMPIVVATFFDNGSISIEILI